jgi:hypothetical protein
VTSNNRRARIYKITAPGRKQLAVDLEVRETHAGDRTRDGSGVTDMLIRRLRYWIESVTRSEALREEMELHLAEKAAELPDGSRKGADGELAAEFKTLQGLSEQKE